MSAWTKIVRPIVKTVVRGVAGYFTGGLSEVAFAALSGIGSGPDPQSEAPPFTEPPLKTRLAQAAFRSVANFTGGGMVIGLGGAALGAAGRSAAASVFDGDDEEDMPLDDEEDY